MTKFCAYYMRYKTIKKGYKVRNMNENIKVAFYGFAVGDAMGVPYEFKKRGTFVCENMRASTFLDSHFPLPLGSWSDDTSLMLCVADALIEKIKYDKQEKPPMTEEQLKKHNEKLQQKIYKKFKWNAVGWMFCGKYTNHGYIIPYDVGNSCRRGVLSMFLNIKNKRASMESSNGNGGLMRILPLAFLKYNTDDELLEYIKLFNHCSHNHNISHIGCLIYIKIIQNLFTEKSIQDALLKTVKELDNKYKIPEYHSFWDASITKNPEQFKDGLTRKKYKNDGIWYQIDSTKLYTAHPEPVYENGFKIFQMFSPGVSVFVETERFNDKSFYVKSREFAEKHNADEDNYIRYFVFCDQEKTITEEITFVK